MRYALNLGEDNRILSATYAQFAIPGMPIVDNIPEGDVTDYLYIDGEYVYDPIPTPEPERPKAETKIAPGEYFTVGGDIYKATTTIPAGDGIVPDTNCVNVNVVDILNEGRTR